MSFLLKNSVRLPMPHSEPLGLRTPAPGPSPCPTAQWTPEAARPWAPPRPGLCTVTVPGPPPHWELQPPASSDSVSSGARPPPTTPPSTACVHCCKPQNPLSSYTHSQGPHPSQPPFPPPLPGGWVQPYCTQGTDSRVFTSAQDALSAWMPHLCAQASFPRPPQPTHTCFAELHSAPGFGVTL